MSRRVLYVDHTAQFSGAELALLNLVRHIDRGRFEPVVVLFSDGPLVGKLREAGVETHVRPLAGSVVEARKDGLGARSLLRVGDVVAALSYVHDLAGFMRREGVDLLHCNSLKADVIGGLAGRLAGKPVVWHVHDRIEADYLPAGVVGVFRRLCRWIPDHVIANSKATLGTLRLGGKAGTTVVYPGVELGRFGGQEEDGRWEMGDGGSGGTRTAGSLREPLVRLGGPVVGMIGRISRWKGQDVFVRAAAEVLKRFPRARFEIVGSALFSERDYEAEVRRQVEALGLKGAVRFVGFCEDVPGKLRELDILVHASTSAEPLGQVVLEAMAAGRAVVATRGGGVVEIVEDGETGVLVEMGDARALARGIIELLSDPARAREMGERGRARVMERFTIEQSAAGVGRVYGGLLGC